MGTGRPRVDGGIGVHCREEPCGQPGREEGRGEKKGPDGVRLGANMAQSNALHRPPTGSRPATSETAPFLTAPMCLPNRQGSPSCAPLPAHPKAATQSKAGSTALHGCSQHMDACGYSVAQSRKKKAGHRLTWARPTHRSRSVAHQLSEGSPLPAPNRFSFGQCGLPEELLGDAFSRIPQHLLFPLQCSSYTL